MTPADGSPYDRVNNVVSLPRQTAATQCRVALAQAEALVENLRRTATALAAEDFAKAARCAEDANRRAHEVEGFTAVVRAQCGQLERAVRS